MVHSALCGVCTDSPITSHIWHGGYRASSRGTRDASGQSGGKSRTETKVGVA